MGDNPRKNNSGRNKQKSKREQTQEKKRKAFDDARPKPQDNEDKDDA